MVKVIENTTEQQAIKKYQKDIQKNLFEISGKLARCRTELMNIKADCIIKRSVDDSFQDYCYKIMDAMEYIRDAEKCLDSLCR